MGKEPIALRLFDLSTRLWQSIRSKLYLLAHPDMNLFQVMRALIAIVGVQSKRLGYKAALKLLLASTVAVGGSLRSGNMDVHLRPTGRCTPNGWEDLIDKIMSIMPINQNGRIKNGLRCFTGRMLQGKNLSG